MSALIFYMGAFFIIRYVFLTQKIWMFGWKFVPLPM
jgi:hypothetical protein